jgi:hypothetical protein
MATLENDEACRFKGSALLDDELDWSVSNKQQHNALNAAAEAGAAAAAAFLNSCAKSVKICDIRQKFKKIIGFLFRCLFCFQLVAWQRRRWWKRGAF